MWIFYYGIYRKGKEMSDKLKTKFQNKCVGLTDDHRDYIYGTDWKGYAKALEKELKAYKEWVDDKERLLKNAERESKVIEKRIKE